MLGHGEPVRVKQGERVLFHILNGSATEIRSLALPGHSFEVVALDGNPVPNPTSVPVLWLGTAERFSAIVHMTDPGVWIPGDLADDDRRHGMGIVVEYAGRTGKAQWIAPPSFKWNYARFAKPGATAPPPDGTFEMTFAKDNAAEDGFNRWTINGAAYPMTNEVGSAAFHLNHGKRYRLRMRNASDDIHPIHLHRHSLRDDEPGWKAHFGNSQRRRDAGRLSGSRGGLRRRQSWLDLVSLPPAAAHGLWLHDPFRLCVKKLDEFPAEREEVAP
jgi:FtsP/CotA-like multicopper oxidase with cupredoxin domain